MPPNPRAEVISLIEHRMTVQEHAAKGQAQGLQVVDPAERGAMGGRGNKASDNVTSFRGNDATYLARRIMTHRPDLFEKLEAGEFPSVRRAAIAGLGGVVPWGSGPRPDPPTRAS